jgi:molybdate transport system substrate-binding protein
MTSFRGLVLVLPSLLIVANAAAQARADVSGVSDAAARKSELIVFAAVSLREAFAKLGEDFKRQHPGVEVTFNLGGSQDLQLQIEQGAAADVFASADRRHMDALKEQNLVVGDRIFARNEPVLAVPSKNSAVKSFEDLPKAKRIVVAAPEVPIGAYTAQILERAYHRYGESFRQAVQSNIVSKELNVRQVLAKVTLGEADAGIVYRTDVTSACNGAASIAIPAELNIVAEYPIALVKAAPHPKLAEAWIELVTSSAGRKVLADFGFLPPTATARRTQ